MFFRSAPIARIAVWVRSVTVTSMMFIMPMPPTMREMAAMPPKRPAGLEPPSVESI